MALTRVQKTGMIDEVHASLKGAEVLVLVHNKGLTVAEMSDLRARMRAAGAGFKIAKNRLVARALEGTGFEGVSGMLKGPTGLAFSKDPVAAAKGIADFAKSNDRLVILGGAFGSQALDAKDVEALAKLPSLDELRGKLIGLLQAPAQRIASVLQAPAGQVARVIGAKAGKE